MSDTFASMPEIPDELIDQLIADQPLTAEGITGPEGLLKQLTKRLVDQPQPHSTEGQVSCESRPEKRSAENRWRD